MLKKIIAGQQEFKIFSPNMNNSAWNTSKYQIAYSINAGSEKFEFCLFTPSQDTEFTPLKIENNGTLLLVNIYKNKIAIFDRSRKIMLNISDLNNFGISVKIKDFQIILTYSKNKLITGTKISITLDLNDNFSIKRFLKAIELLKNHYRCTKCLMTLVFPLFKSAFSAFSTEEVKHIKLSSGDGSKSMPFKNNPKYHKPSFNKFVTELHSLLRSNFYGKKIYGLYIPNKSNDKTPFLVAIEKTW